MPGAAPASRRQRSHGEGRRQLVRAELRSAGIDGVTFLRCSSEIGLVDLSDVKTIDRLRRLQCYGSASHALCARYQTRHRKHELSVEASLPFDPATTQYEEVRELVRRVARQADRLEHELLGVDAEPTGRSGRLRPCVRLRDMLERLRVREWNRVGDRGSRHRGPDDDTIGSSKSACAARAASMFSPLSCGGMPSASRRRPRSMRRLALRAWARNAKTELVNFTFDDAGRLVGEIRHPADHLDATELAIYLQSLGD